METNLINKKAPEVNLLHKLSHFHIRSPVAVTELVNPNICRVVNFHCKSGPLMILSLLIFASSCVYLSITVSEAF